MNEPWTLPPTSLLDDHWHNRITIRNQLESDAFKNTDKVLPISLGVDVNDKPVFDGLAKLPHLLIAGATGSGKSVGLHAMIMSLLYKYSPDEVKLIHLSKTNK